MELYEEMLYGMLVRGEIKLTFTEGEKCVSALLQSNCYRALQEIKAIVQDESLEDPECFMKIEEIICVLEELGSDGGNRHDFG